MKINADETAPLLAPLLEIPVPPGCAAELAPEETRRRQLASVVLWVLASARTQPIVLAFEDLHWADPTTIEVFRALAERGAQAPLLLVATTRPEFRPPWGMRPHHSAISLPPLDRAQVRRMVGEIASRHALSKDVVEGVGERAGGVPLFVEEVTRLLLERGEQGAVQAIPPTLQQSLAARLDRLGPARETAQIGAVLGRDFSYALLRAVGGIDDPALQSALDRLAEADILIAAGAGDEANYRFRHALIQDAAYDSLLKSRRQALHRRAAEVLRDQPERAAAEVIAHHFTEARLDDLAIEWWGKAGDQALRRSAFQEAIAHLGKAIAMADRANEAKGDKASFDVARDQRLTPMRVAYANALMQARGYGMAETTEAFAKVRDSTDGDRDVSERLAAGFGMYVGSFIRGELSSMRAHAEAFLNDAELRPGSPEVCVARRAVGITHWFAGEYDEARVHLERALALFQPGRDDDLAFRFGHDPGVAAMFYLAMTLWPQGEVERGVSLAVSAQERVASLAHVGTLAYGKTHAALFQLVRSNGIRDTSHALEITRVADEHDLGMWRAWGVFLRGWARSESDSLADGLTEMRSGADLLRRQNALAFDGLLKISLGRTEAQVGEVGRALGTIDEALATSDRIGHRTFDAELHRLRGEFLLKRDPVNLAPAEEALQSAVTVARLQSARSFGLRAALSLAKLYDSTGRPAEAHTVLAPALEGFTPTPEMPEIAQAQALLAVLAVSRRPGSDDRDGRRFRRGKAIRSAKE